MNKKEMRKLSESHFTAEFFTALNKLARGEKLSIEQDVPEELTLHDILSFIEEKEEQ